MTTAWIADCNRLLIEINLLDSNLDAEHGGRKLQKEFLLDHPIACSLSS